MAPDFKDIWKHFLDQEKKNKDPEDIDGEDKINEEFVEFQETDEEYFKNNFDKYLPQENKDDDFGNENRKPKEKEKKKRHPNAQIDLHGKTVTEGLKSLEMFLKKAVSFNLKRVLIIVGKGIHSEGGEAVLRDAVLAWFNNEGQGFVSTYEMAPSNLGGKGAILLTLKRRK